MQRSPRQRNLYVLAILFAIAPIAFSLIRALRAQHDFRMLWMALVALVGTVVVMAAGGAGRRSRRGLLQIAIVALIVAVLLAGWTAMRLGATAAAGIWPVAFVLSFCWVTSYVLAALSNAAREGVLPSA
ncbi:MAG TPA: hypothetical protein VF761_14005 [Gemmatimonadaceae bacterium]